MTPTGRRRTGQSLLVATALVAVACDMSQARRPIDIDDLGPQVGERVPDFALPDQNGRVVTLDSILKPNGAVLLFYRSADW